MALSGSQITGTGVLGFPWQAYAGFTAKAESAIVECSEAVISIVQSRGQGISSTISDVGVGVLSSMQASEGLLSIIQSRGQGVSSPITSNGVGVESTLC